MLVLRNLALSSLEVGLAQLAQTHYKFDHLSAGLLCAITVFITLPVQFLYESSERCRFSLGTMLWTGLAASCLLLSEKFLVFYLGALLFFPMMVLSSGLVMAQLGPEVVETLMPPWQRMVLSTVESLELPTPPVSMSVEATANCVLCRCRWVRFYTILYTCVLSCTAERKKKALVLTWALESDALVQTRGARPVIRTLQGTIF